MENTTPAHLDGLKLGNISAGRQNLGEEMPVEVYRMFQYAVRDELDARLGKEPADELLRGAGRRAGLGFAAANLVSTLTLNEYLAEFQRRMREFKIGILRVETLDPAQMTMTLTIAEDADCSGLPVLGETVCVYDEGFIAGVLEHYTGARFEVMETDCWATGFNACRFAARQL